MIFEPHSMLDPREMEAFLTAHGYSVTESYDRDNAFGSVITAPFGVYVRVYSRFIGDMPPGEPLRFRNGAPILMLPVWPWLTRNDQYGLNVRVDDEGMGVDITHWRQDPMALPGLIRELWVQPFGDYCKTITML